MKNNEPKKILIADDESSMLLGLSKAIYKFCDFNGEVKTVENGKDAIDQSGICQYDICFLDLQLPDINGLDVMKEIKKISPETKIAIMTASFIDDDMKKTIEEGASIFFPKPINLTEIKAFIKEALEDSGDFNRCKKTFLEGFNKERRQVKRQTTVELINCSISIPGYEEPNVQELKCIIVNVSDAGMGINTDSYLEPGGMLRFIRGKEQQAGIVQWSMMVDNNYRVGIKFV